jgi:hypothetical protein
MSNFLRKFKNNKVIMTLPESFLVLQVTPCKEIDFVKWSEILINYGIEVKYIKPSNLHGIFTSVFLLKIKNIFQVSSIFIKIKTGLDLCLFKQYALFLEKELNLSLVKEKKVKVIVAVSKGKFYHFQNLKKILNTEKTTTVQNLILTSYKPIFTSLSIFNLPLLKLLLVLKKVPSN